MKVIVSEPDRLGDCPTWDSVTQRLLWIDIIGKRLSSCEADGSDLIRHSFAETPGSFALRANGGVLLAFRRRLVVYDPGFTEVKNFVPPSADMGRERFNDGACDPKGRFWVGTMDRYLRDPVGALYRIDPDLTTHRMDDGIGISNGIAWNPTFDRLYHCDSRFPQIYVHDFDLERGTVKNRRVFAVFKDGIAVPDGCAVDVQGILWVATPGAPVIAGFDPDGRLRHTIETPTAWVSSVVFGGPRLSTLFATSLEPNEGSLELHRSPGQAIDGAVFASQREVSGMPRGHFHG